MEKPQEGTKKRYNASVIIPVYNDADELKRVLTALEKQTVPSETFEIIVVDNDSTDHTRQVVSSFKGVKYLIENVHLNSPYSCRNRGIEISGGGVIILLDGTCIPEPEWMENGLKCLERKDADIISSHVIFDFRGRVTAAKIYDSNNLSKKSVVENKGVAKTASLFVRKKVFDKFGTFPEGVRSGADVRWTRLATHLGFRLAYCHHSVARKKARTYFQSIKKQWRVGKGQPEIWREEGREINLYKKLISSMIPYNPRKVNKLASGKGVEVSTYVKVKLYFVAYSVWIVMSLANIYGDWKFSRKDDIKLNKKIK